MPQAPAEAPAEAPALPAGYTAARLHAGLVAPWYAPILYRLIPVQVPGSSEVRIRPGWRLEVGEKIPEPELAALLIETCDHVEREHLERRGDREAVAWSQAATVESVSAWTDVLEGELGSKPGFGRARFPRNGLRPELFGLPPYRTAEEYYRYFSDTDDEPLGLFGFYGPPSGSSRPHEPEAGRGLQGEGRRPRSEPGEGEEQAESPALVNLARSESPASAAELQAVRNLVRRELRHAPPGTVPGSREREAAAGRARIPWQVELARLVGRGPGRLDYSLLPRPNYARLVATGALGSRLQRGSPRTTVVRDTSASMDPVLLGRVAAEIRSLARSGPDLTVVDADTRVQAVGSGGRVDLGRALGGGGTDMLAAAWEAWRMTRPECLIVITDGETRWDEGSREPPGTVWVILNEREAYVPSRFRNLVRVRDTASGDG